MMAGATFDRYLHGTGFLHRLDPRVKVIVTVLYVLSNLLIPDGRWTAFSAAWLLALLAARLGRVPLLTLLRRSLVALPFALAAITVLFNQPGALLWQLELPGVSLTITDGGVTRFTSILTRSWLSVQMAVLLTAATPFPDLMHALRHLRVPPILVAIISFMYRYLFVLAGEAERMLRARAARSAAGAHRSGGALVWRARVAGGMVGQLFLRSYERSERVYQAMLARGYRGQLLTMNPHLMERHDWLALAVAILLLLLIQALARLPA